MKQSFFVRRSRDADPASGREAPQAGWTGPIRSPRQVEREAQAWRDCGWTAVVEPATAPVRAEVRAWEKAVAARRAAAR